MDSEDVAYLEKERKVHVGRLRVLKLQKAQFGISCPPEVQTEIADLEEQIIQIDAALEAYYLPPLEEDLTETSSYYQIPYPQPHPQVQYLQQRSTSSHYFPVSLGGIVVIGVGVVFVIAFLISVSGSKLVDSFSLNSGLGAWRSRGIVTLVKDGKEESEALRDGVQIQPGTVSFIFRAVPNTTKGAKYTATVWCKAPIGSNCRIYLGALMQGMTKPTEENDQTMARQGTEQWESMTVTAKQEQDEPLNIFLYAEGQGGAVVFDDVSVREN